MEIIIENVSHIYGKGTPFEKKALDQINLKIQSGQFVGIIGQTGSGKSTLIQHINGLLKPTEGTVRIGNEVITSQSKKLHSLRKKVGLVFQYPENQLFEETVLKDVMFGPLNYGLSREDAKQRAKEALKIAGFNNKEINEIVNRSPFTLSGGQMRRVAIAGVLALNPEVVILDEPTAGLDPRGRHHILDTIYQMHVRQKWTTFLVTHNMEAAARYADWLVVMNQGKIVLQGTPQEIFSQGDKLGHYGLDVPEITRFIEKLNQKITPPIPTSIFRIEELEEELLKRKQSVLTRVNTSNNMRGDGEK